MIPITPTPAGRPGQLAKVGLPDRDANGRLVIREWSEVLPGIAPRPLPKSRSWAEIEADPMDPPPLLVDGILHQGCKMTLAGTSKSNKSWCLLDLAISVASGQPWWGRKTTQVPVCYVNLELHEWAVAQRINAIIDRRPQCLDGCNEGLSIWNLRGHATDLTLLRPRLEQALMEHQFGLLILDPIYQLLGNRNENSNGDITSLLAEVEGLAQSTGAAVVLAHHFAKGDFSGKAAMDRMAGAGAWIRDPDSIMVLSPHEEEDHFTVTSILRNLPRLDDFVVRWQYPLMTPARGLDPEALRRPPGQSAKVTDLELLNLVWPNPGTKLVAKRMVELAESEAGLKRSSTFTYASRMVTNGLLVREDEFYVRP